jgi:hypothetical protein
MMWGYIVRQLLLGIPTPWVRSSLFFPDPFGSGGSDQRAPAAGYALTGRPSSGVRISLRRTERASLESLGRGGQPDVQRFIGPAGILTLVAGEHRAVWSRPG